VLRSVRERRDGFLVLALAFPVLGALAPLLPANDLMPGPVRLVHALETIPYFALYGCLLALWFGSPRSEKPVAAPAG
jgi:hypothetical protein